ncbi:MAG TPA: hypothetical protein VGK48_08180 [Terriglobia bacterium]
MNSNRLVWGSLTSVLALALSAQAFAQAQPVQNRIPQQVIINGQRVNGAYVPAAGGGMQSFTCSSPQQYAAPDGSSQGWSCFDQATGVWLLNAVPPSPQATQQAPAPVTGAPLPAQPPAVVYQQQPTVIYQQPYPATVVYAPAPVYYAPAYYPPGYLLGAAAIGATGRIVSAALLPRYSGVFFAGRGFRRR